MMESTAPRRGVLWLTVLALAFSVVVITADQASAAKPDPQVLLAGERTQPNNQGTACNYTTVWELVDVKGKWARIQIETRSAGAVAWTEESFERQDIKEDPTPGHTETIFGEQPEYLETRVTVFKNNGSVVAVGSTKQTCDL